MEKKPKSERDSNASADEARENLISRISSIQEELDDQKEVLSKNPEYFKLLSLPGVEAKERVGWLRKIFDDGASDETLALMCVLAEHSGLSEFSADLSELRELVGEGVDTAHGYIYSVKPMTEEQIRYFRIETEKLLKKKIVLVNRIDRALLGGVCISVDGKMIDLSLRKRLEDMHISIDEALSGKEETDER